MMKSLGVEGALTAEMLIVVVQAVVVAAFMALQI